MRRLLTVLALAGTLVAGLTGPASASTDVVLVPPPIPATGNPEVQFVGAGATPARPVDNQSLVSAVVAVRTDDIYNVAVASNNPNGSTNASGLRSVAAGLQIVFVKGQPAKVTPVNGAYAYNYRCTGCFAYAFARQTLVYVPENFSVTGDLRDQVEHINAAVSRAVRSDRTPAQLDSDLNAQFSRLEAAAAKAVNEEGGNWSRDARKESRDRDEEH